MTDPTDASDTVSGPSPGDIIADRFHVVRVVGSGGMGVVVEALNVELDERVALKFLRQDVERSPALVERFAREARSASKLRSEHVARVSDAGTHPTYGPFMVMDLLEGSTLAELLVAKGPLPVERAAEYVIHACEGLAEAHAHGIVHQDVKPANLFLARGTDGRGVVKVLDFGISKATLGHLPIGESVSTGRGSANLGTPHYLSPEQLRSASEVDHRADVWSLGCVLFELLAGEKAFRADRFTELVAKILESPRAPLPSGVVLPSSLVAVIDRCLEKDRAMRYATTAELALALLPYARSRAHSVASLAVAHVSGAGLDPHLTMPSSMPPRPSDASIDLAPGGSLRAPRPPTVTLADGLAAPGPAAPGPAAPGPAERPSSPVRGRSRRSMALLFAAAVVLVAGVAAWLGRATPLATPPSPSPSSSSPSAPP
jgi:eukaryotic-like serine/threonine-protein kinase